MEKLTIALAGNPNVGKSTIFNALTGMKQHTGNWAGKTVANAFGEFTYNDSIITLADLPGTYSLFADSAEEKIARDYICFEDPDGVIVVCDATCLERNLNLVIQILEVTPRVILCINLIDEAEKKQIQINAEKISSMLNIPVVCTCAKNKCGIEELMKYASEIKNINSKPYIPDYPENIKKAINMVKSKIKYVNYKNKDWLSIRILENDSDITASFEKYINIDKNIYNKLFHYLCSKNLSPEKVREITSSTALKKAEKICSSAITYTNKNYKSGDIHADKILTGITGIPLMLIMLMLILWITIEGANYPSALLSFLFEKTETLLETLMTNAAAPPFLIGILIHGIYRTLGWVVSVMLPPMAIFFPLFTILEDIGYLPRIAFSLDKCFKCCGSCGKQSLTMCMGFGCNAVGVTGCRIISSPRERLIAMLTNSFMPCNGRFPMIISIITVFFVTGVPSPLQSLCSALFLTLVIAFAAGITFAVSFILSKTLLKGIPSSFTLELPPYRIPQISKVIIHSFIDRTLKILVRAIAVAIPAGAIIWILANTSYNNITLMKHLVNFTEPLARIMGLDGTILTGFILGLPANETVIPVMFMSYLSANTINFGADSIQMSDVLIANGWNFTTALCAVIFAIFHWPCSTTIITMYKECHSIKWTALAVIIPTLTGILLCMIANAILSIL